MTGTISTETLKRFIGGEAEIQNGNEEYLYRGEIGDISVDERDTLNIKFVWSAKNRGGPPPNNTKEWDSQSNLAYGASLEIYTPMDVGDGRLSFNSFITGELLVLFPPDGSKMNPEHIEGLAPDIRERQAEKFRIWDASR